MNARVAADALVGGNLLFVAAGQEDHAAIFQCRLLQGHPDAQRVVVQIRVPICLVLVPRRRSAHPGGLEDCVVARERDARPQKLLRDGAGVGLIQRLGQFRCVLARAKDLRQGGGLPFLVGSS